ncbi:MAG: hypothetical protein AVO38_08460 [delta proteobacterium ML8_D]|nr:MAG: hypothetical protein AVO38_08460 [delta proteobacterium ML8_D]
MKKIIIAVTLGLILGLSVSSFAATGTNGGDGDVLTIADTDGGSDFTFTPSPNVLIGYNIDDDGIQYAINTLNNITTMDNGLEYGTASDATGYYQRQREETLAVPSASDSSAFSGWYYVGGGDGVSTD